jgi:hypothetical protein
MHLPSPKARARILWTVIVADLALLGAAVTTAALVTVTRDRDGRPR